MSELLEELAARPDEFRLSLVTGNLEPVARLKLARAGVGALLRAPARAASAPTTRTAGGCRAIARGARPDPPWPRERTRRDRRHAARHRVRAGRRVRVAAVATGPFAVEALADADAVVDDARALLAGAYGLVDLVTTIALPPPRRSGSATARSECLPLNSIPVSAPISSPAGAR